MESVDFRKGIDSLAELCRQKLDADPFSGYSVRVPAAGEQPLLKVLVYDGQGFWPGDQAPVQRTLPLVAPDDRSRGTGASVTRSHQAQVLLLAAGNPRTSMRRRCGAK